MTKIYEFGPFRLDADAGILFFGTESTSLGQRGVALLRIFLEQAGELGKAENPYWAVLACPSCGSLGLITRQQCAGLEAMICGSSECSAEYFLEEKTIRYRLAN